MNNGKKSVWGIILVVIGCILILDSLHLFRIDWVMSFTAPGILLMIAFFFFAGFMSKGPSAAGLLVPAGILAGVGATLLLGSTFHLMTYVWPGFILAPAFGLFLLYVFSKEHSAGLLVPVGILTTVAMTCFISSVLGIWEIMWPGFVLSPAVGLLLLYLFGEEKNNGLLIPVFILGGISAFSFFSMLMISASYSKVGIAAIMIIGGMMVFFGKPGDRKRKHRNHWFNRTNDGSYDQTRYSSYENSQKPPFEYDNQEVNPYSNSDYSRSNNAVKK